MSKNAAPAPVRELDSHDFYSRVVSVLNQAGLPFLLGGGFAFEFHTGVGRTIKDLDIFVKRSDLGRVFEIAEAAGFRAELTFHHWLGKIFCGDQFIDVIFSSGNGLCQVDDVWFEHAARGIEFGLPVLFSPVEEMIWSKAFVMERERYDGSDVVHLLLKCGPRLDWHRLLRRFGPHWRVLLSHLILFGYIYPRDRLRIPAQVMRELLVRLHLEIDQPGSKGELCRGPLLSRMQYIVDVEEWGYKDGRLEPSGKMTPQETADWTAAGEAENEKKTP